MRELKGKVAVVTGAASGIGRAMAERFAREGMRVVLADVEDAPLAETRAAIARTGADVVAVPTDVSKWDAVETLARRTIDAFGAAHVLCNNAGVAAGGPAWELSQADWEWVLGVNLWGVVHGLRAFVPRMIAQGEGHVVNTASIAGLITMPGLAPYAASKHAVVAISECLHHDLAMAGCASTVHVSVVCPAWVKTNIAESDRNRPASLPRRPVAERSPQEQKLAQVVRGAVEAGLPPQEIADHVVQAVLHDRFWVLTHRGTEKAVEKRLSGVVDGKAPEFHLADA
jgi:NAD(P)-dependent dehydrogenase (short-subunit alcohol dehydrogenase family)